MTSKEHKEYVLALKKYSDNLLKSENNVKDFLVDAGIHTQTGRLTKVYSSSEPIGYKSEKSKQEKSK
ncbi:hypothetical protein GOQ30_02490 [Flavobacterium sp. TP390]|uniref:Uncharacterized protein n=1 Tax=Flavobacterium profundi TaxID=1774945 RepID=A0A6I4IEL0_9FLAO|nr:hypothetical protein [Flavobacterium profundi]MVO08034.1 hypothetical protein [Flavobacterium profundi]